MTIRSKVIFGTALIAAATALVIHAQAQTTPAAAPDPIQTQAPAVAAAPAATVAAPPAATAPAAPATTATAAAPAAPENAPAVAAPSNASTIPSSYYLYANNGAEYSIALPEAPTVDSIWGGTEGIPYLDEPPSSGFLGEIATFKRLDLQTDDIYNSTITFLNADAKFLAKLNEQSMRDVMESEYKDMKLEDKRFTFTAGTGSLKWATLTAFAVDRNNHAFFYAMHYLTGVQSIMIIKVQYALENKTFREYYQHLADSITYHPL